MKSFN